MVEWLVGWLVGWLDGKEIFEYTLEPSGPKTRVTRGQASLRSELSFDKSDILQFSLIDPHCIVLLITNSQTKRKQRLLY